MKQATKDNVSPGTFLVADGYWTCLKKSQMCIVAGRGMGYCHDLFTTCDQGMHPLTGDVYKGFLKWEPGIDGMPKFNKRGSCLVIAEIKRKGAVPVIPHARRPSKKRAQP
jgi:hypothetical protein